MTDGLSGNEGAEILGALETFVDRLGTAKSLTDHDKGLLVALQSAAQLADAFDDLRADDLGGMFREAGKAVVEREELRVKLRQQEVLINTLRSDLIEAAKRFAAVDPELDASAKAEPTAASVTSVISFLVEGFGSDSKELTAPLRFVLSALMDSHYGKPNPLGAPKTRQPREGKRNSGGSGSPTAAIELQAEAVGAVLLLLRSGMPTDRAVKEVEGVFAKAKVPTQINAKTGEAEGEITYSALKNWVERSNAPTSYNDKQLAQLADVAANALASAVGGDRSPMDVIRELANSRRRPRRNTKQSDF